MNILNHPKESHNIRNSYRISCQSNKQAPMMKLKNVKIINSSAKEDPKVPGKFTFAKVVHGPTSFTHSLTPSVPINININNFNIFSYNSPSTKPFKLLKPSEGLLLNNIIASAADFEVLKGFSKAAMSNKSIEPKGIKHELPSIQKTFKEGRTSRSRKRVKKEQSLLTSESEDSFFDECKEILKNVTDCSEIVNVGAKFTLDYEGSCDEDFFDWAEKEVKVAEIDHEKVKKLNSRRPETSYGGAMERLKSGQSKKLRVHSKDMATQKRGLRSGLSLRPLKI